MKVIILAAGQGSRLRPLTDTCPKCMVEVKGKSIVDYQIEAMKKCGIQEKDITIVAGYCSEVLQKKFEKTDIHVLVNPEYDTTNMVYSLMCAENLIQEENDLIISYGDIIYTEQVLQRILRTEEDMSVITDDGWLEYWSKRCENPLDDAETLMIDGDGYLTEIGQKTEKLENVQSQYIGLMRFRNKGLKAVWDVATEAKRRSEKAIPLWRTDRTYAKMYMTDLLQGLIDENYKLKAERIHRGWFEIDDSSDLKLAEDEIELLL